MTDQEKEVILSAETADAEQSSETIDVGITGENSSEALGKTSTDAVNDAGTPPLTKDNTKSKACQLSMLYVSEHTLIKTILKSTVDILLKATGNAPIMKKKKWAVSQEQNIGWISDFMKRYLKLDSTERLVRHIYTSKNWLHS